MSQAKFNPLEPKVKKKKYPSFFGSHESMINPDLTAQMGSPTHVVCTDEHGDYITTYDRLDDGLADPNRYEATRIMSERKSVVILADIPLGEAKVKDNYEGGVCPDCQEEIPDDMVDGGSCSNCGHVFFVISTEAVGDAV